jgi:hypothetical protein
MSFFCKFLLLGNLALLTFAAYGQQDANLPLGALPMQYNGSFAGEAGSPRISTNAGFTSGHSLPAGYDPGGFQQHISFDQFVPALSTGFGVGVYGTQTLKSPYGAWGFSAAVAPKISLKGKWTLSPSLDLSYDGVHDEDQQWRSRAGLLVNTHNFYLGYSVAVFDQAALGAGVRQRFSWWLTRYSSCLQIGYTFQRSPDADFSFTPQLAFYTGYRQYGPQGEYNRFVANLFRAFHLNFRYKRFLWGVNNTGVHVGWQSHRMRLTASNAISLAGRESLGYSGNLSFRYVFKD